MIDVGGSRSDSVPCRDILEGQRFRLESDKEGPP